MPRQQRDERRQQAETPSGAPGDHDLSALDQPEGDADLEGEQPPIN